MQAVCVAVQAGQTTQAAIGPAAAAQSASFVQATQAQASKNPQNPASPVVRKQDAVGTSGQPVPKSSTQAS